MGWPNLQPLYRAGSVLNDVKAASKGPRPFARRVVRRESHKLLARLLRRL